MLLCVEQILVLTHNSALYMDIMCREHGSFFVSHCVLFLLSYPVNWFSMFLHFLLHVYINCINLTCGECPL